MTTGTIDQSITQLGGVQHSQGIDEAFILTLKTVLDSGHHIGTHPNGHPDKARGSMEIINFQISMQNPRDRILTNPIRRFNCVEAAARLVWTLGANNRTEDISFYQPKARAYSDNQITIPGSNYGMRIFESRPGLNQAEGVIKKLENEVGSRRGAIAIWQPEDAVRDLNDIPCAFGMFFHLREDQLILTTVMRSNNAFLLLPYNMFEFSLLGEMIAVTLGVKLGPYVHFAASMHIFDDQSIRAREAISAYDLSLRSHVCQSMPAMPRIPAPFEQANDLARLEAQLRQEYALVAPKDLLSRGERLHEYWRAFYNVLLIDALCHGGKLETAKDIARHLPDYFRTPMEKQLCR